MAVLCPRLRPDRGARIRIGKRPVVGLFTIALLTVAATVSAADPAQTEFEQLPAEVSAHLQRCDQQQLDPLHCSELLAKDYMTAIREQQPPLAMGYLAEANALIRQLAARQLGGNDAIRHQLDRQSYQERATEFYTKAKARRVVVSYFRQAEIYLELNSLDDGQLASGLANIDQVIDQLPAAMGYSRWQFALLASRYQQARLAATSWQQADGGETVKANWPLLAARFDQAATIANQFQLWPQLVDTRLAQWQACAAYCPPAVTNDFDQQALTIAHQHQLRDKEVALLLIKASAWNVDEPGSADVVAAETALSQAGKLAKGKPPLQIQVLASDARLAMSLGRFPQAMAAVSQIGDLVATNPDLLQTIDLASLLEKAAFSAYRLGDLDEAVSFAKLLVTSQQHQGPLNQQAAALNLAIYQAHATTDSEQQRGQQQLQQLASDGGNPRIQQLARHNLAALAASVGNYPAAIDQLQPLLGDDSAGTYHGQLGLLLALNGQLDEAHQALIKAQQGFDVSDEGVRQSLVAIAQQQQDPEGIRLHLVGGLLAPEPIAYFSPVISGRRVDSLNRNSGYLLALPTNGDQPLPRLAVGSGHGRTNNWLEAVSSAALSPDRQLAASCDLDGQCILWQTTSARTIRQLKAGSGAIAYVYFSADGERLITLGQGDSQIKIWQVATGLPLASLQTDVAGSFDRLVVSGDGRFLIAIQNEWYYAWDSSSLQLRYARSRKSLETVSGEAQVVWLQPSPKANAVLLQVRPQYGDPRTRVVEWQLDEDRLTALNDWQPLADSWLSLLADGSPVLANDDHYQPLTKGSSKSCNGPCSQLRLAPFSQALKALGDQPLRPLTVVAGNHALITNSSGEIWLIDRHQPLSLFTSSARPSPFSRWRQQQLLALVKGQQGENQWQLWDNRSGRVTANLNVAASHRWQGLGDQLWWFDGLSLGTLDSGDGQLTTTTLAELPRWDDRYYPTIEALAEDGKGQLVTIESNGYYGDERITRLRQVDRHSGAQQLATWQLTGQLWLLIDGQHQRLLVRDDGDWSAPVNLHWLRLSDGHIESSFTLPPDLGRIGQSQVQMAGDRLVFASNDQLYGYDLNGTLQWQWPSPLGAITNLAVSADQQQLVVAIDATALSFIQRLNPQTGAPISSHSFDHPISQISFNDNHDLLITTPDGGLNLWPETARHPLASLFHLKANAWLVLDHEGRYDSNQPGDIDAVSWVLADAPLTPLPLQLFMRDYYQPGLLGRLLAGEPFPAMPPLLALNRSQPQVAIDKVEPTADGTQVKVTIRLTNHSDNDQRSGARDLRLFRNGQLVAAMDGELLAKGDQRTIDFDPIALPPGNQPVTFSAYAFNPDGIRSERASRSYTPNRALTANERVAYLVTIGVNDYQNPAWNLRYAANDAEAMDRQLSAALAASGDYDRVISLPLISAAGSDQRATKAALSELLAAMAGASNGQSPRLGGLRPDLNDSLLLSFSGHGYVDDQGQFYFLLEDIGDGGERAITPELLSHALSSDELSTLLLPLDVGQMVMVVDACHSAASIASGGFKPGPMGSRGLGQLAYDKAMIFLTASQAEQFALESDKLQHGFLSYALLVEGLAEGKADLTPSDGQLQLGEWLAYGVERVPAMVKAMASNSFNADRGFSVSRPSGQGSKPLDAIQRPYLFDFSAQGGKIRLALPPTPTPAASP